LEGFEKAGQLGVHSAWFSQPPQGFDALTVLALAAGRTSGLQLGTAVIPVYPHHPLVTVRAVQTVAAAAPGRIVFGVSSGHRSWIENEYGQRFDRPVRYVAEWIRTARRLLGGEALTASDNLFGMNVPASEVMTEVPIVLAASRPQLLRAAGEVADGVLTWMCDETYLGEVVVPAVACGAAEAKRATPPVIAGMIVCLSDEPERARAALRPRLAPFSEYDSYRAVLSYHRQVPREPADLVVIGAEAEVRAAFGRLAAAGVAKVVAIVLPDSADAGESLRRAHRLLAALASRARAVVAGMFVPWSAWGRG
jgi:5,10-methylenetetrahydromethanopterin reductase